MAEPVDPRVNKAILPPDDVRSAVIDTDVKGGPSAEIEDTSYDRIEALRAARAAGAGEDTSYDRIEDLRAARAGEPIVGAGEDTSYDRIEDLRAARAGEPAVQDTSYDRVEAIRAARAEAGEQASLQAEQARLDAVRESEVGQASDTPFSSRIEAARDAREAASIEAEQARLDAVRESEVGQSSDTSYDRIEALRAARAAGEDTSYDRIEELRAARAGEPAAEDTSYDRVEEMREARLDAHMQQLEGTTPSDTDATVVDDASGASDVTEGPF